MPPPSSRDVNAEQIAYWNGPAGRRWSERQVAQDRLFAAVTEQILARAAARPGERVIDLGCGAGALSVALASQVLPGGQVLGIDVSAPLLEVARRRTDPALPVEYQLADASVHSFAAHAADLLVSRFGSMFFADPPAAFRNLHGALRRDGRLVLACWREPRRNPFFLVPLQAACEHVPRLPEIGPEEPGPFAFAQEARVRQILASAGFGDLRFESLDLELDIAGGAGLDAAVESALAIGPASRALEGQPDALRAAATARIRAVLAARLRDGTVPLAGSIWLISARA